MIHAAGRLFGSLRAFFEQELRGIGTWDDVTVLDGELADEWPHKRRNPYGLHKEIAAVKFRDYELTVKSPFEAPPLGLVECRHGDQVECGPLDQTTWTRLGKFIRNNEATNGRR